MKPKSLARNYYDLGDHSMGRVIKQNFLFRLIPFGNFSGGPNLKFLLELWILHRFGRLLFTRPVLALVRRLKSPPRS